MEDPKINQNTNQSDQNQNSDDLTDQGRAGGEATTDDAQIQNTDMNTSDEENINTEE